MSRLQPPLLHRLHGFPAQIVLTKVHVLVWMVASLVATARGTTPGLSPAPTAAPTTLAARCPDLIRCQGNPSCVQCLGALNNTDSKWSAVYHVQKIRQRSFFRSLVDTPGCNPPNTPISLLNATFQSMVPSPGQITHNPCAWEGLSAWALPNCQKYEFNCFADPTCRQCLVNLFVTQMGSVEALNSSACRASRPAYQQATHCPSFPKCSLAKFDCQQSAECSACWETIRAGNREAAFQQCRSHLNLLGALMANCVQQAAVACEYFSVLCQSMPDCGGCLTELTAHQTPVGIVAASNTTSCRRLISGNGNLFPLLQYFDNCPITVVTSCQYQLVRCIFEAENCRICAVNTTYHDANPRQCQSTFDANGLTAACEPCPNNVFIINRLVLATSVVGGISVAACAFVLAAIFAYGKDRDVNPRFRILAGLMVANALYSCANIAPLNRLKTGIVDCGQFALSYHAIRSWRAVWFMGKFGLVSYELLILGAGLVALRRGPGAMSPRVELGLHSVCVLCGFVAFAVFFIRCNEIIEAGYNRDELVAAQSHSFVRLGLSDDLDDDLPGRVPAEKYVNAREAYVTLEQRMLQAWLGFLAVTVAAWIALRTIYAQLTGAWARARAEAEEEWTEVVWSQTELDVKRRVNDLAREGYDEVARPLEPFVAIFMLFGIPALVMATDFCQDHSNANTLIASGTAIQSYSIDYGICYPACELVLAFRSVATALVFLWTKEHRAEVFALRTLLRRLGGRLTGLCGLNEPRVKFHADDNLTQVQLLHDHEEDAELDAPSDAYAAQIGDSTM